MQTYTKPSLEELQKYADLAIVIGVNLQPNQELVINTDVADSFFARLVAQAAYNHKAKRVTIIWRDEIFDKIRYSNEELETLTDFPNYQVEQRNYAVDKKAAYLSIISEDPELLKDIDPKIISSASKAKNEAFEKFYDASMSNFIRWNIIAVPSVAWAEKVFPELESEQAVNKLWNYIFKTMRLDLPNPIEEWKKHHALLKKRSNFLNSSKLKKLHYTNSLGTDLIIELPKNYLFVGCGEEAQDGFTFTANMPTEEIYSAPYKTGINGKVVASMPLIYNGTKIEDFGFTFENGKIVDFYAKTGYEVLKNLIDTDEGSHYLGEVALVQYNSPIQNLKTLFYNTLFDENASCHLAIGQAYPSCISGGESFTAQQKKENGLNDSLEHVDFMIGTSDLSIEGIDYNNKTIKIFENGNFVDF